MKDAFKGKQTFKHFFNVYGKTETHITGMHEISIDSAG